jgi:hypothetical protein
MSIQIAKEELNSLTDFQKEIHVTEEGEEIIMNCYKGFIKSTWYSSLPMKLKCSSDGEEIVYPVDNSFHFLLYTYMRFLLPAIKVKAEWKGKVRISWCHNIGTNIVLRAEFKEDHDIYHTWDNVWEDIYHQFYQSGGSGKRETHNVGVGNVKCLEEWSEHLPSYPINVDQPWFYSMDPALAFPILFKNSETRAEHRYTFRRKVSDLLRIQVVDKGGKWKDVSRIKGALAKYIENPPLMIKTPELWGRFSYNSEQEVKWHKTCRAERVLYTRDVEICDTTNPTKYSSVSEIELHSTNPCLALFWVAENKDSKLHNNYSNYTTDTNDLYSGWDPIKTTTLKYGTSIRLNNMPSDHFNIAEPRKHFPSAPNERGYHGYSYASDSTNFNGLNAKLQCRIDNNSIFADNIYDQEEEEKHEEDEGEISESVDVDNTVSVVDESSPNFITRARLLVVRKFSILSDGDDKYSFKIQ